MAWYYLSQEKLHNVWIKCSSLHFGLHLSSAVTKEINDRVSTDFRNIVKLVDEIWNSLWHSSSPEEVFNFNVFFYFIFLSFQHIQHYK